MVCGKGEHPKIDGRIVPGDFRRMLVCLDAFVKTGRPPDITDKKSGHTLHPIGWVYFNSEGGDVSEAIKIGKFLRQSLAEVVVSGNCFSACFLAVVGAVELYGGNSDEKIGIHRVFLDSETLRRTEIKEYETYYNELRKRVREYLSELDVSTPIVEKMFSVSSREIYILSDADMRALNNHPAYEEWINARCPNGLSVEEREDYKTYNRSGRMNGHFSDGYVDYLKTKASNYRKCVDSTRWAQFEKTVAEHLMSSH